MIAGVCGECGGKVLLPDPPGRTQEEKVAFRKRWDAAYDRGQARMVRADAEGD